MAGRCVGLGYLGDPRLTAQKFPELPHSDGTTRRCYLTGDLVRSDGEVLTFLARVDGQIKIGGYRVEPGEVEAAIVRVPAIQQIAVVPYTWQDTLRLAACYVAAPGTAPTARELRAACSEVLPGYMVPSRFHQAARLPLNLNGKIDRAELRRLLEGSHEVRSPAPARAEA